MNPEETDAKEWFINLFNEEEVPRLATVGTLFSEHLGTSVQHLVETDKEKVETWMSNHLRVKQRAKLRLELKTLRQTRSDASTVSTLPESISILSGKTSVGGGVHSQIPSVPHPLHNHLYQASRREVPRQRGTFVIPAVPNNLRKTIMIVGETGCGKTTTLNSMVNYLWGVDLMDHYRLVLIPPPSGVCAQAHSVTARTTLYQIQPPKLMYGLNIIDTPGFGDTKGLEADMDIVDDIENFLRRDDIPSIDAILLTVRASGRLDARVKYVLNCVLRLFGKDMRQNLFTLVTFADGSTPPILSALEEAEVKTQGIFELNNSAFFTGFEPDQAIALSLDMCYGPGEEIEKLPPVEGVVDRPQTESLWQMGNQCMKEVFLSLHRTTPHSLTQTLENLQRRRELRRFLDDLVRRMDQRSNLISKLRQHAVDAIEKTQAVERNQHYNVKGTQDQIQSVKTPGTKNLLCPNCLCTCITECPQETNQDIKGASIMDENSRCTVCPSNCHWSIHVVQEAQYETRSLQTQSVRKEMKRKFDSSLRGLYQLDYGHASVWKRVTREEEKILECLTNALKIIHQLSLISMNPTLMEQNEFYQKQKVSEQAEKKVGMETRIKFLDKLEAQAEYCRIMMDKQNGLDSGEEIFSVARRKIKNDDIALLQAARQACTVAKATERLDRIEERMVMLASAGPIKGKQRRIAMSPYKWWKCHWT